MTELKPHASALLDKQTGDTALDAVKQCWARRKQMLFGLMKLGLLPRARYDYFCTALPWLFACIQGSIQQYRRQGLLHFGWGLEDDLKRFYVECEQIDREVERDRRRASVAERRHLSDDLS